MVLPPMQTFLGLSRIPPHELLLNGPVTSVHWRLAIIASLPIHGKLDFDRL